MAKPPLGTLWIQLLPLRSPEYIIGIDTAFFNVNHIFKGIKVIPPGIHLFHYLEGESMRAGWWFEIKDGDILSIDWDCEQVEFRAKSVDLEKIAQEYPLLVLYPENHESWLALTKHIEKSDVVEVGGAFPRTITTATPLKEENQVLEATLKEKNPKQTFDDQSTKELNFSIINFKETERELPHSDAEVTRNALDRSWQLRQLFPLARRLLAEFQISFAVFLMLANLCSCTQWTLLLRLVLVSETFLRKNCDFSIHYLETLLHQLENIPEEYVGTSELGVVDTKVLVNALEQLGSIFHGTSRWQAIEKVCQARFGFHLKNLVGLFDKDNFEVYNIEDHDTDDEDAPAIV